MIAIGTCSKFPAPLNGRRVRVLPGGWPRAGYYGYIVGVSGPFALPHDGLGECECVHVAVDSGFDIEFNTPDPTGERWSGFPPHALELVPG